MESYSVPDFVSLLRSLERQDKSTFEIMADLHFEVLEHAGQFRDRMNGYHWLVTP
jgi:hypothetical protein